jgi:hypothetical protein
MTAGGHLPAFAFGKSCEEWTNSSHKARFACSVVTFRTAIRNAPESTWAKKLHLSLDVFGLSDRVTLCVN